MTSGLRSGVRALTAATPKAAHGCEVNKNLWKIFQKVDTANGVIIVIITKTNLNIFAGNTKNDLNLKVVEVLDMRRLNANIA